MMVEKEWRVFGCDALADSFSSMQRLDDEMTGMASLSHAWEKNG